MELEFEREKNLNPLFATPLGTFPLPNADTVNPALEAAIRERAFKSRHWGRSNIGGWRSGADLLEWPEVAATDFQESIRSAVLHMVRAVSGIPGLRAELALSAWCNLNREGAFNQPHNHPRHQWSGVYYVRVDAPEDGPPGEAGRLVLHDPRGAVNMLDHPGRSGWGMTVNILPRPGMMVLFPSWLFHHVQPFRGEGERISVAFNARIDSFEELHPV